MQKIKILSGVVVAMVLVAALFISFAPISAQSGEILPTPTPHPVENADYELTTVGGEDVTLTFDGMSQDGITIGETSVNSDYPRGMRFTMTASSDNGDIVDVLLFAQFAHGSSTRFEARWDDEAEVWVAHPWESGEGQPAWTHFEFIWRVRDDSGVSVDTTPISVDYWDPNRAWHRVESEYIILYWFGFEEVEPEYVAENIVLAVHATEPRRIEGFGGQLSYKPVGVVYPNREALGEISGSGVSNTNAAGYTSDALGMTVQHVSPPDAEWFERQQNCIYLTPLEERTEEWRVNGMIFSTVPHEIAHLYQYDKGVSRGPNWWVEGQADYFTYSAGQYDARLRHLASLQDIHTLRDNIGAFTYEADGCYALAYDMGVSFFNWFLSNYGGLATHAQVMELLSRNILFDVALEEVTGKSFFELENEWRAYLGYAPFTQADLDPASALGELVDPLYQVGDSVTFPGPRPAPLYDNPGVNQISNAACFAGTPAEITRAGNLDGVNYYEIDCGGLMGWVAESQLPLP